ncbi:MULTISPECIES: cupin domain-containing protein [unclassified Ensifer]|uniref:cupin domain-containing protein n=1 Tax=unclassified Ensifer TaxID=2633371 RepID=UPI000813A732|nr:MULTISPECIES: cupin domain-containing protein [unclassified Ensifer]OCP02381.1 cupin [Ensifer sp. LC14]OCP14133.1 cupin [Ensifer sp. LC13]OCP14810.1 cupin [Ensifer sp. LC11]OCP34296.1 cupin [Ensifer sp. LC499]
MSRSSNPGCRVVRPAGVMAGQQGLNYFEGIAAETVGATGLCMHIVTIPPGARAKAHLHESHETAIYVLSGEAWTWFGERLEEHVVARAGEMVYIPAGVPHLPENRSDAPCSAVIARTDPNQRESLVLLPELDALVPA